MTKTSLQVGLCGQVCLALYGFNIIGALCVCVNFVREFHKFLFPNKDSFCSPALTLKFNPLLTLILSLNLKLQLGNLCNNKALTHSLFLLKEKNPEKYFKNL